VKSFSLAKGGSFYHQLYYMITKINYMIHTSAFRENIVALANYILFPRNNKIYFTSWKRQLNQFSNRSYANPDFGKKLL